MFYCMHLLCRFQRLVAALVGYIIIKKTYALHRNFAVIIILLPRAMDDQL